MGPKPKQREKVIKLRRKGLSYSEIKRLIPVSKSSLSLWLKGIALSDEQIKRLRAKGDAARLLGSKALKDMRIKRTEKVVNKAISEVGELSNRELWLIGTALYWAEGAKQKDYHPSQRVCFSNSDPLMIKLYLKWLRDSLEICFNNIRFEIYIHETYQKTIRELTTYWSEVTDFPIEKFNKVYFKKNKVNSFRRNRGPEYNGVLRITIVKSTDLNRKITGWTKGICMEFLHSDLFGTTFN